MVFRMAANEIHNFTWIYLCVIIIAFASTCLGKEPCPCASTDGCIRPSFVQTHKEVFVVTSGKSDFNQWRWEAITSVLATKDNEKTEVMCAAHMKKKRYGFIVDMLYSEHFNVTGNNTKKWKDYVVARQRKSYADIVGVNLLDSFLHMTADDVDPMKNLLESLKSDLTPKIHLAHPVDLICVVPWQPPYYDERSITQETLYSVCDFLMIQADSFANIKNRACKAQATVPFTKLALGVDEYATEGIRENRIILGVPWHGYQYVCQRPYDYQAEAENVKCQLATKKNAQNETYCDVKGSRTMISVGTILDDHYEAMKKRGYSDVYQAPVYSHLENKTGNKPGQLTQIWFENIKSLRLKYQYAHDFDLKGVAVFYAEDLSASKNANAPKGYNKGVWDWVQHGILVNEVKVPPPPKYHPDVVAGAAIGCLLLGVVLGVLFTCLALRHRVKKKEIPFRKDRIEYHDDDDLNL